MTLPRGNLIHRLSTQRDVATGTDGWNQANAPNFTTHLSAVPCRAWTDPARGVGRGVGAERVTHYGVEQIDQRRALVALGTDVTERDRVVSITDAAGNELFDGPMNILAVLPYADHLELMLQRVR